MVERNDETGVTTTLRDYLEDSAQRGNVRSAEMLEPRPYPPEIGYLHEWALALFGRSGSSMAGVAPLSYTEVAAWAQLKGLTLEPYEVHALFVLDAALSAAGEIEDEGEDEPRSTSVAAWPERKREPEFVREDQ